MIDFDWQIIMIDPCDGIYLILVVHFSIFHVNKNYLNSILGVIDIGRIYWMWVDLF
jgi:hypothetical protein